MSQSWLPSILIIKGLRDNVMEISVHYWVSQQSVVSFKNKLSGNQIFFENHSPPKTSMRLAKEYYHWRSCYVGLDLPVWLLLVLHETYAVRLVGTNTES